MKKYDTLKYSIMKNISEALTKFSLDDIDDFDNDILISSDDVDSQDLLVNAAVYVAYHNVLNEYKLSGLSYKFIKMAQDAFNKYGCLFKPDLNQKTFAVYLEKCILALNNAEDLPSEYDFNWIDTSDMTDFSYLFDGLSFYIVDAKLCINKWNTSNITNMKATFNNLTETKILDLSGWDTSNVTDMSSMFKDCYRIEEIIGIEQFDVHNVKKLSYMFENCKKLTKLDLSNWNVSNKCRYLRYMFHKCESLLDIDLTGWDTSNVESTSNMFDECIHLKQIKGIDKWDLHYNECFKFMFNNCKNLLNIGDLSNWKVNDATDFSGMFAGCISLKNIGNISNWYMEFADNISYMFLNCRLLKLPRTFKNWNIQSYCARRDILLGCDVTEEQINSLDLDKFS